MLRKSPKITDVLTYLYIGLPMMIFLIGWVRWYISIPVCLILLYSFFTALGKPDPAAFVIEKKPFVDDFHRFSDHLRMGVSFRDRRAGLSERRPYLPKPTVSAACG